MSDPRLETKVADTLHVGLVLTVQTLFGPGTFTVDIIDETTGTASAKSRSGNTGIQLLRKPDGWYDQHTVINLEGLENHIRRCGLGRVTPTIK